MSYSFRVTVHVVFKNNFVSLYLLLSSFNVTLIIGLSIIFLPIYCRERNNIMK